MKVKRGKKTTLGKIMPGELFATKSSVSLMTEYFNESGRPRCYLLETGETFWNLDHNWQETVVWRVKALSEE